MLNDYYLSLLSPLERNKEFSDIAELTYLHNQYMYHIQATCRHEVTRGGFHPHNPRIKTHSLMGNVRAKYPETESGACWICGKEFGWYCPDSPDHICDYYHEDLKGFYQDDCIYCHQPKERK